LIQAVSEGQALGRIRPGDPGLLAQLAWSGVHGCLALPINFDRLAFAAPDPLAMRMIEIVVADLTASTARDAVPDDRGEAP
jgi:hypothetical protein